MTGGGGPNTVVIVGVAVLHPEDMLESISFPWKLKFASLLSLSAPQHVLLPVSLYLSPPPQHYVRKVTRSCDSVDVFSTSTSSTYA